MVCEQRKAPNVARRRECGSRRSGSVGRAIGLAAIAALAGILAETAAAQDGTARRLRIASWNLAEADASVLVPRRVAAPKPVWRHTFGAERRTTPKQQAEPHQIDADIVLLQGVTSLRSVRDLFPPRDWRLVVSRQLLLQVAQLGSAAYDLVDVDDGSGDVTSPIPVTAVLVRYQTGRRVTGKAHVMDETSLTAKDGSPPTTIASTGVRVRDGNRTVWAVSVAFSETCEDEAAPCPERQALETWRRTQREAGVPVVVGGQLRDQGAVYGPLPVCSRQAITIEADGSGGPARQAAAPVDGSGCIALMTLGE